MLQLTPLEAQPALPDHDGWSAVFRIALTLSAVAHGCVLLAGAQIPWRLNWREELKRLSPFNRKLFRVYFGFIGGTVVAFGALTWVLRAEMLAGETGALALAGLIGLFWLARIVVDAAYFDHSDWPRGPGFVVGHALLLVAFVGMATAHLGLVAWHVLG